MNIYLNNNSQPSNSNMVTFNALPTILEISGSESGVGRKAKLLLNLNQGSTESRYDYYITINNATVYATNRIEEATGNYFYYPNKNYQVESNYVTTSAITLAAALNTTSLAANYNVYAVLTGDKNTVVVEAKESGTAFNFTKYDTNINWMGSTTNLGTDNDILAGTEVYVDVYAQIDEYKMNSMAQRDNLLSLPHVAQFSKKYFKKNIKFNLSPILNNLTNIGKVIEYNIVVTAIKPDASSIEIGRITHIYAVNGYQVNNGEDYLININNRTLAQNTQKGIQIKDVTNKTTLFYTDHIYFSMYVPNPDTTKPNQYVVRYLDSTGNIVNTETRNFDKFEKSPLVHCDFVPEVGHYYTEILVGDERIRYTNLVPTNYDNPSDNVTIVFYNSYGGQSFFPFTKKVENNFTGERTLYKKSNLDYYNTSNKCSRKVYDIENKYEVTVQSHYMNEAGIWTLRDLQNSLEGWVFDEKGVRHEIIIEDVQIEEQDINGVYKATVKYTYSLPDRF